MADGVLHRLVEAARCRRREILADVLADRQRLCMRPDQEPQLFLAQLREVLQLIDGLLGLRFLRLDAQQVCLRQPLDLGQRANLAERRLDLNELALRDEDLEPRSEPLVVCEACILTGSDDREALVVFATSEPSFAASTSFG